MCLQPAPGQLQVPAGQAPSVWSGFKACPELQHLKSLVISVSKKLMGQNPDVSVGVSPPQASFLAGGEQWAVWWHNFWLILGWDDSVSESVWFSPLNNWEVRMTSSSGDYLYLLWVCPCSIRWGITLWCCLNNLWLSAEMCLERTAGAELYCLGVCNR